MVPIIVVDEGEADAVVVVGRPLREGYAGRRIQPVYMVAIIWHELDAIRSDGWLIWYDSASLDIGHTGRLADVMRTGQSLGRTAAVAVIAVHGTTELPDGKVIGYGSVIGLHADTMYPHANRQSVAVPGGRQLRDAVDLYLTEGLAERNRVVDVPAELVPDPLCPGQDDAAVLGDSKKVTS